MAIFTLGIDLAKNVFVLHGVDQYGKAVLIKPKVARGQLLEMVAQLPPMPHHSPRNQVNYPRTLKPTATENGGTSPCH